MATARKEQSKEVALFGNKESELPAHLQNEGPSLGNEDVGQEDVAIPRLSVLQALSPQVNGDDPVEGAKPGQLHVSVTNELYDSVYAVNLTYKRDFAVFRKRNQGGGFHGNFETEREARDFVDTLEGNPDQYEIQETAKHVLLLLDNEGKPMQPVQLFLANTKLAVSRAWNSEIQMLAPNADRFASVWEISTTKESNTRGTWYNLRKKFVGWAPEDVFAAARRTYYQVTGGDEPGSKGETEAA